MFVSNITKSDKAWAVWAIILCRVRHILEFYENPCNICTVASKHDPEDKKFDSESKGLNIASKNFSDFSLCHIAIVLKK